MRTNEVAKTISATRRSVKIPSRQPLRSRPARFKKSSRVSIQLSNKEESQVRGHSKRCGRDLSRYLKLRDRPDQANKSGVKRTMGRLAAGLIAPCGKLSRAFHERSAHKTCHSGPEKATPAPALGTLGVRRSCSSPP